MQDIKKLTEELGRFKCENMYNNDFFLTWKNR